MNSYNRHLRHAIVTLIAVASILVSLDARADDPKAPEKQFCHTTPTGRAAMLVADAGSAQEKPGTAPGSATPQTNRPSKPGPAGMVWIPGGEFTMGTDEKEAYPAERPAHRVRVSGFWMDESEVTNQQFRKFVQATGHKTTAERPVDWEQLKLWVAW